MFRRDTHPIKAEPVEDLGKWWERPQNLALLIRCQWLYGNVNDVEDVLTILENPTFWESEFERMIKALDAA
jgi:hypothetical protein